MNGNVLLLFASFGFEQSHFETVAALGTPSFLQLIVNFLKASSASRKVMASSFLLHFTQTGA